MLMEAETWVALAFVLFVGLLGYLGVHRIIAKSLDDRASRIKAELDEARKLKDEAAALLAEYQRKRQAVIGPKLSHRCRWPCRLRVYAWRSSSP